MDVEEYVKGAPVDPPAPGLHTCYYNKFFLLKMPVEVNGKRAQVKLNSKGSPVLSYCPGTGRDVDLSLSLISQNVARVLMKHGVYHVDTFYYHDVPMFSVSFASEAKLRKFVSTERDSAQREIQELLGSLFGQRCSNIQKPWFVKQQAKTATKLVDVKVQTDLFLITPSRSGQAPQHVDIRQVTPPCVHSIHSQWHASSLFTFGIIDANTNNCRYKGQEEEEEAQLKDLLNELSDITYWFRFGANLEVPEARLFQIKKEHRDIQDCIQEVIVEWKKQETPKWSKVVHALTKMDYKHKAETLAMRYGVSHCIKKIKDEDTTRMDKNASDFEDSRTIKQLDMEQKQLSKMIEKDNREISELQRHYENTASKVIGLTEKLQNKEEQRDALIEILDMKQKEIKKLNKVFKKMMKEKEEEIKELERELSIMKEELSEYSTRIQDLQKELDKKTTDYEQLSRKVTQLEIEKNEQEKRFEVMQTEYEQKLQCEAARTLGATEHAKEVEHQLKDAKNEASSIMAKLQTIELEKKRHIGDISRLESDLQQKKEEIHKLQRNHSMAAAVSTGPLTVCEEEQTQLFKLIESASNMKLELIEAERQKAQMVAEHAEMNYKMESLRSKLADLGQCTVQGEGLQYSTKYQTSFFKFCVRNEYGKPCTCDQNVFAVLRNTTNNSQTAVHITRIPDTAGDYEASYTPSCHGSHELSVLINGDHLVGSPFSVLVDNPPDPQHCSASGPGVEAVVARDKGNPVSFEVHLADSDNEPCITEQNVTAVLRMVRSGSVVEKEMSVLSPSVYQFSYIPWEAGIMEVEVNVNGAPITKCPFEVHINNLPDLRNCVILSSHTELQEVKKNWTQNLSFDIQLVDSYNEQCIFKQDVAVNIVMRKFLPHTLETIPFNVIHMSPSLYQVYFVPDKAGEMEVSIMVNGAHIQHSPWNVHVHNPPDPQHCKVSCPDLLHKKGESLVLLEIHLRDLYDEPVVYEEEISVAMWMRKSRPYATESMPIENLDTISKSPSLYQTFFIPDKAGEWILDVKINGIPAIGSPLNLTVDNPPCIDHCEILNLQEQLQKGKHYIFRIKLADSEKKKCELPQCITAEMTMTSSQSPVLLRMIYRTPSEYDMSITPHRAGWMTGCLIINGTTTRSIKALVTNTPDPEHCTVLGPGLESVKKHKSNPVSFQVKLADSDNEPCVSKQRVEVTLKMKSSGSQIPVEIDVYDYPPVYDTSYIPVEAGEMEVSIMVNGAHIKDSPWNVQVHNTPDPEHCTALGPGLESVKKHKSNPVSFQVKLADSDNEPCVFQREVTVVLTMKCSGSQIPVVVIHHSPAVYDIMYIPVEAGEMEVSIMVNGAHIKHSPQSVNIHNPPDPQHCEVACYELLHKEGGKPVLAYIYLKDSYNEPCLNQENISLTMGIGRSGAHVTKYKPIENLDIICMSPSVYLVSFIPDVTGECMVNVKCNDMPILGSPFELVIDNPPFIEHCEVLNLQKVLQRDTQYTFRIRLADSENKGCIFPQHVTATLKMTESQSPVPVTVTCETPSQYAVSSTPHRIGWMTGCLNINGLTTRSIEMLVANTPDPEHCTAQGPGLELVKKSKNNPVSFQVMLADSDNEPCVSRQKIEVTLKMKNSKSRILVDNIVMDDGTPHVYYVLYTPIEAGEMEVSILVNGIHIKHSPWNAFVDNTPDPLYCRASCSEVFYTKGESKPISAQIHLMDKYNEPCVSEKDISIALDITKFQSDGTVFMPIDNLCITYKSPSLYQVSFFIDEAGEWLVDVKINGVPLSRSLHKIMINNPPCIEHCEILDLREQLKKSKHYTFRIRLVDSENKECEIPQHVTATLKMIKSQARVPVRLIYETPSQYAVSFTPHRAGWMTGCLKISGITTRSIEMLVTNTPDPEHCTAQGPGLESVNQHKSNSVSFQVKLADSDNEPCVSEQRVEVTLKIKSSGLQIPVEINVDHSPPVYNISYIPVEVGEMEVSIMVNGAHIKHSPWNVQVHNPPDPQHCRVVWLNKSILKGKTRHVLGEIHLMDSYNEPCAFKQDVTVTMTRKDMKTKHGYILPMSPSVYQVSLIPDVAGEWTVNVEINHVSLSKGTFKLVIDNPPCIRHCTILDLQKQLLKGKHCTFRIILVDSDNERCEFPQDVTATLTLTESQSPVRVTVTCETPSQYAVSFTPHRTGWMRVCVKVNDVDMESFVILVSNTPDPEHCTALGPGLKSMKKRKSNPVSFQVKLADSENEPCVLKQRVRVTLKMKSSGLEIPVEIDVYDHPPVYDILYTPVQAGEMEVSIMVSGVHIKHSPWNVQVHNTPDPQHCRVIWPNKCILKGKTRRVLGEIHLMDSYNEPCAFKQDVTVTMTRKDMKTKHGYILPMAPSVYQVSLVPDVAGEWTVNVEINHVSLSRNTFKLVIDNPPIIGHCKILDLQEQLLKGEHYTSRIMLADSDNERCEIPQHVAATLTLTESQSPTRARVICETISQYAVSFTSRRTGWMTGYLQVNDIIMQSINILVSNTPDPEHCTALGPGLESVKKHKSNPVSFQVMLADSDNEPCVSEQRVEVTLKRKSSGLRIPVEIKVNHSPPVYDISYTPVEAGEMEVSIMVNGAHIKDSPQNVQVYNTPDPEHCTALGPGLESVKKHKSNPVSFQVKLADSDNEPCVSEQRVEVTLKMKSSGLQIPVETKMHGYPPVYDISYTPVEAGEMEVSIMVNGAHIKDSPQNVQVYNTPDPEHCTALGPGLESVKKHKSNPVSFQVKLADSDNEPCVSEQRVEVTLKMKSSGLQIPVETKMHGYPPVYDVSYTPVEAGEMEVSIMVNGAHIKHSPRNVQVHNPPDPQHCRVIWLNKSILKGKTRHVLGEIHLMDSYDEPCVSIQDVTVTMARKGMKTKHGYVLPMSPSLYQLSLIPDVAGEWTVNVEINHVSLSKSTFKLVIDNPPIIGHCKILDLQKQLLKGKHCTFRIILVDSDNERCEFPQDVTATLTLTESQSPVRVTVTCETTSQYAVSFTPHTAGWMTGYVKVNDIIIQSINILVSNTPDPEHCTALGPGLESVKKHKSNPVSFQVKLADSDNEPCVSEQRVEVTLKMKSSGLRIPVEIKVHDNPPVYDISYTPVEAGEMEVSIMVNGTHIKHSPRSVRVHNWWRVW